MTTKRAKLCSQNEALAHKNDAIVHKFLEKFDVSFEEAEDLFTETRRFLWLAALIREEAPEHQPRLIINEPLLMMDEMWHTFVLFTREYEAFCLEYLGGFIHHAPTTEEQIRKTAKELEEDPAGYEARLKQELYQLYEYVYDHLGAETAVKWYEGYGEKYPAEVIEAKFKGWTRPLA